jgi:CMP-N,N'-diacetyllegionaminic acid synthase
MQNSMSKKSSLTIVGAICARGGSKGVPRKNIRSLLGVPLIGRTIQCAKDTGIFDAVVVSTDDAEIAQVATEFGGDVPFMRPSHLAQDDSPKWPVFQHLVEQWEKMNGKRIDVLVDLDIGVPLREPQDIQACVDLLLSDSTEVVSTAYEAERNPYFNMVELDGRGMAKIVKTCPTPIAARQAAPQVYSLSPAVYAIRRSALWDFEHWSQAQYRIVVIPRERAIDIDTETDFRFVEFLMTQQHECVQ